MINIVKPSVSRVSGACPVQGMELIEYCGRICHKTADKAKLGSYNKFIRKFAQRMGHESILEHVSVSYEIVCDRATSHQIVRHRLAAYSQESQRYCDVKGELNVICPPKIENDAQALALWKPAMQMALTTYRNMRIFGIPPEDARSVLPNCTATTLVMTCNLRNWRHIIKERALNNYAQWQIKQIFTDIFMELVELYPCVFDDLEEEF